LKKALYKRINLLDYAEIINDCIYDIQGGGGYETKQATIRGGWDKCLGPFDHYQAKAFGIDIWDCHSNNCYIRKDHNGGKITTDQRGEYANVASMLLAVITGRKNNSLWLHYDKLKYA